MPLPGIVRLMMLPQPLSKVTIMLSQLNAFDTSSVKNTGITPVFYWLVVFAGCGVNALPDLQNLQNQ